MVESSAATAPKGIYPPFQVTQLPGLSPGCLRGTLPSSLPVPPSPFRPSLWSEHRSP